jgi:hypothetical protein
MSRLLKNHEESRAGTNDRGEPIALALVVVTCCCVRSAHAHPHTHLLGWIIRAFKQLDGGAGAVATTPTELSSNPLRQCTLPTVGHCNCIGVFRLQDHHAQVPYERHPLRILPPENARH